ncbi:hypothetical protein PW5551_00055 [Petrotoga sp. 9PW.55.5.1]|uniref:hypothetical protein n=1 Tax=Petrotoga sp. 9PW.55.5.1 TaxID=1308979 RepID=UPI000DC5746B|nr:hypothetical protein [Petrotoga sp. 9PW.55.5.1]RAP00059.1 hypothetical protein PW5551_00055 [Petrotoga sp. 9PW.55.5.1]
MKTNNGFLLVEIVFEIFILSLTILIVLGTFAGTFHVVKSSLIDMVELNIVSNSLMAVIYTAKNEMKNVTSFDSSSVLGDLKDGSSTSIVGFSYNPFTKRLNRYRKSISESGSTLIGENVTEFSYDGEFLNLTILDKYTLKLYIKSQF